MKVNLEFTPDELLDATERFMARSRAITSWRRKELVYSSLISGSIGFLIFLGKGWAPASVAGVLSALIAGLLYPPIQRRTISRRLRSLIQEKLNPGEPLICEVELTKEGVEIRQGKNQTIYDWEEVKTVKVVDDSVEVFTKYGGGVIVRNRAFKSDTEKTQFVNLANSRLRRPNSD